MAELKFSAESMPCMIEQTNQVDEGRYEIH